MDLNESKADRQILVTKLITGTATQEERDRALASVMLSLWDLNDLKSLIRLIHKEECDKCPLKQTSSSSCGDEAPWQKVAMILLRYGGWALLIIAGLLKISVK